MTEDQMYQYTLNPIMEMEYNFEDRFRHGVTCGTCKSDAPYGDERNLWLGYHLSWYHKLWYKIKEDPAFGIFRVV